jgi:hypothetical protein
MSIGFFAKKWIVILSHLEVVTDLNSCVFYTKLID